MSFSITNTFVSEAYNSDVRVLGLGLCYSVAKGGGIIFPPICIFLYNINK